jgi:tetratricopeptide (TPR) repeat protein
MNRLLTIAVATVLLSGCALYDRLSPDPNYDNPFYAKYLNTGSELDGRINETLNALRQNPSSPSLHNELGSLLVLKGFPKDAEREFERAIDADSRFYPAWYNLGLVRASRGDELGARRAFSNTIDRKPGHAQALFELGLIEEKRRNLDAAVELYAKAFTINPALLGVRTNPRVLDSKLTHLALLKMYPDEHERRSMFFQGTPAGWQDRREDPVAPSPEQTPEKIVSPAPPATDPSQQPQKPPV